MKSASKPTGDQAKNDDHICLFCAQRIVVEKSRQGTIIALNKNTLQSHECPNVHYLKSQLKMPDYKENNENIRSNDEHRSGQSDLLEFIQRDAADNENDHDDDGNAIRTFNGASARRRPSLI